jgi:hypothetical protein
MHKKPEWRKSANRFFITPASFFFKFLLLQVYSLSLFIILQVIHEENTEGFPHGF